MVTPRSVDLHGCSIIIHISAFVFIPGVAVSDLTSFIMIISGRPATQLIQPFSGCAIALSEARLLLFDSMWLPRNSP